MAGMILTNARWPVRPSPRFYESDWDYYNALQDFLNKVLAKEQEVCNNTDIGENEEGWDG